MGTIERVGYVSIVLKGEKLYLRGTIEGKSRWIKTGLRLQEVSLAIRLARELSLDIEKSRTQAGFIFPYSKWQGDTQRGNSKQSDEHKQDEQQSLELARLRASLGLHQHKPHLIEGEKGKKGRNDKEVGRKEERDIVLRTREGSISIAGALSGKESLVRNALSGKESLARDSSLNKETFRQAWDSVIASTTQGLAPSTIRDYAGRTHFIYRMIDELKGVDLRYEIGQWLVDNATSKREKRYRTLVNKALILLGVEPLEHCPKFRGKGRGRQVDCFTEKERDLLCQLFFQQADGHTRTMAAHFVKFCFYTGCRLGEAAGLHWADIEGDSIRFHQRCSATVEGLQLVEGLKTQDFRFFPINKQLRSILTDIQRYGLSQGGSERLFFAADGGLFHVQYFGNCWRKALNAFEIRYRKPYAMRHSFITQCLGKNVPVATIAAWVGNSPAVIYRHYAGVVEGKVPEF